MPKPDFVFKGHCSRLKESWFKVLCSRFKNLVLTRWPETGKLQNPTLVDLVDDVIYIDRLLLDLLD